MAMRLDDLVVGLLREARPEVRHRQAALAAGAGTVRCPRHQSGRVAGQLTVLELRGFVDRTQGRGSYLAAPDVSFVRLYFDISRQLGHLNNDDLDSAREILEVAAVEAATDAATAEDIDTLRHYVDRMVEGTARGDWDAGLQADFVFYHKLFKVVNKPIFNFMHDGLNHALSSTISTRRALAAKVAL
jgi:DNA-binding FadR family transcriptional regulator